MSTHALYIIVHMLRKENVYGIMEERRKADMIRVDEDFMTEVGLAEMPAAEAIAFMEHAEEELEVRVGQEISAGLSDMQLNEFAGISDKQVARAWLEENVPDFREIVAKVFENFKQEIMAQRQQILS